MNNNDKPEYGERAEQLGEATPEEGELVLQKVTIEREQTAVEKAASIVWLLIIVAAAGAGLIWLYRLVLGLQ